MLARLPAACAAPPGGADLGGEFARQRSYLEKTIDGLKRKLAADAEAHRRARAQAPRGRAAARGAPSPRRCRRRRQRCRRADELRMMGQNVELIRELNELRREIKVRASVG